MNRVALLLCRVGLLFLPATFPATILTGAQQPSKVGHSFQRSFGMEDEKFDHPVALPSCVRVLLGRDRDVSNVLESSHLSPEELSADWFRASEIGRDQSNRRVMVVMGVGQMLGASTAPIWIFRWSAKSCDLLLSWDAQGLEVLKTKTNGLDDIEIATAKLYGSFQGTFKFNGQKYQQVERVIQQTGEEIPTDLSGYETRRAALPPVKDRSVLTAVEARGWLWRQWRLGKPSRLRVTAHSKEGDVTTTDYYIRKTGERLDVLIHRRRVQTDRVPHPGIRLPKTEDEIEVATDVERRWALADKPDRETEVPENEDAAPDTYELYFLDEGGGKVDVF